jgi:prepilin-type N-terminal cleavage/methylation domain-containing protein
MSAQRGMTAIELMIVIALVGIVAAMAAPNIEQMVARARLSAAANILKSAVEGCADDAANNGVVCTITLLSEDSALTDRSSWQGSFQTQLSDPATNLAVAPAEVYDFTSPGQNKFAYVSMESQNIGVWAGDAIQFSPDGLLMPNAGLTGPTATMTLRNKRALPQVDQRFLVIDRGGNVQITNVAPGSGGASP